MAQVDKFRGLVGNLGMKAPAKVGVVANITLSGLQTLDDVALTENDRVLVMGQDDPIENGLYNATSGPWVRTVDFDSERDVVKGTVIRVTDGTEYAGYSFGVISDDPDPGTNAILFESLRIGDVPLPDPEWGLPRGYLTGLTLSNNATDATNDIDISDGCCRDDADVADMILASALTKRLDATWAVGTNQGGLDEGSIADDVYFVWLIKRSDTDVVDVLLSASDTSPTMPVNYDSKRRIGAIIRRASAILGFIQDGDLFRLKTSILDVNTTGPGTSSVASTVTIPDTQVDWYGNVEVTAGATDTYLYLRDSGADDEQPSTSSPPLFSLRANAGDVNGIGPVRVRANESSQITWRSSFSSGSTTVRMATLGWFDSRGRND